MVVRLKTGTSYEYGKRRYLMKKAVIADIHGNLPALQMCVSDALSAGADGFLFLGDYLGDLPYVRETLDFLYHLKKDYPCVFLRGNKEDYWLHPDPNWKPNTSVTGTLCYVLDRLTDQDIDWFREMPDTLVTDLGGPVQFTACHSSPGSNVRKLLHDDAYTEEVLRNSSTGLILFGHTHVRDVIRVGDTIAVNGGSVGYPQRSSGKAQYLLLYDRSEGWDWEFRDICYDIEAVIQDMHRLGLYEAAPCWAETTALVLKSGEISHRNVMEYASRLAEENGFPGTWEDVNEHFFEEAVKRFYESL